jgi:ribosomal protein S18 acetylase RimI-like enzyme
MDMIIREAVPSDFDNFWPILQEIASSGETYAYPQDLARDDGFQLWVVMPRVTFVAEEDGQVLGAYYLRTNQAGLGDHVCNCGYIVSSSARGRGVATAMCEHSQQTALRLGYKAMQFNFVASSNGGAVRLWSKLGFATVGRLPKAFRHPSKGYIDAMVMYKWLE